MYNCIIYIYIYLFIYFYIVTIVVHVVCAAGRRLFVDVFLQHVATWYCFHVLPVLL